MVLRIIQILALVGLLLSFYALKVERRKKKRKNYNPVCDINENISCTKAFTSEYNSIAGISNAWYGILFYAILIFLANYSLINYIFFLALLSFLGSIYLAYLSYGKLKTFCFVCSSIYLINLLIFILAWIKL